MSITFTLHPSIWWLMLPFVIYIAVSLFSSKPRRRR